jgi:hypothetical protein
VKERFVLFSHYQRSFWGLGWVLEGGEEGYYYSTTEMLVLFSRLIFIEKTKNPPIYHCATPLLSACFYVQGIKLNGHQTASIG